ncbi:acyltransferase family protein [Sphingomonas sp. SAFR-052]|uniref:acyltransferase family protein n=1 Tax=Sphingomonas sp. SAFR-052 TaxID=3436867 RepID=UPI003F7EBD8F
MTARNASPTIRLYGLDGLRGLMCIGIALYHYLPYYFTDGDAPYDISRYFACFTDIFFVFGGFFVGNVIERKDYSLNLYRQFIVDRLARLYPLHIATLGFYAVVAAALAMGLVQPKNPDRYDPTSLLPHVTLTHGWGFGEFATFNYPSWAVSAIFGCCLLLPTLRLVRRSSSRNLVLLGVLIVALFACSYTSEQYATGITLIQQESLGIIRCIPSFIFGVLLSRNRGLNVPKSAAIAALLIALAMLFGRGTPVHGVERLLLVYILVSSVVAIDAAGIKTPLHMRLLRSIATYSFGIYLIHSIIATILFQQLSPKIVGTANIAFGEANPVGALLFVAAGLFLTLLLAMVSYRTVEPYGARLVRTALSPKTS